MTNKEKLNKLLGSVELSSEDIGKIMSELGSGKPLYKQNSFWLIILSLVVIPVYMLLDIDTAGTITGVAVPMVGLISEKFLTGKRIEKSDLLINVDKLLKKDTKDSEKPQNFENSGM